MVQQGLKIGQEGLKIVLLTKQNSCFFPKSQRQCIHAQKQFLGQEMHTKNAETTVFGKEIRRKEGGLPLTFFCSLIHVSSKGSMLLLILIYENLYFLEI